ncbi:MAG: ATP-grasp domain-containing protein, partial [Cytophagales bacterium]|nr:ATP-grasp domain-containing protein [Armatimonadota bacterium]
MLALFPGEAYQAHVLESAFAEEQYAATAAGMETALLDFEALTEAGDARRAVRGVSSIAAPVPALYRGWMLSPTQYEQLYRALAAKNWLLINTPDSYRHAHFLPENYSILAGSTPETVWLPVTPGFQIEQVFPLLRRFGDSPVIVKDYVKSQKHHWNEACFIPAASDQSAVRRVVARFLELQGGELAEGLVFRAYAALKPIGTHLRSGMPLTAEFRCFFLDGELLAEAPYWDEAEYDAAAAGSGSILPPPSLRFAGVARQVRSRFFTMDVAQQDAGG